MIYIKVKEIIKKIIYYFLCLISLVYLLFPFVWLLLSSFKHPVQLFSRPPEAIPNPFVLSNYLKVFQDMSFLRSMFNSSIVAVFTTLLCLALGTLGAYVFARKRFRGRKTLLFMLLGSQMLPFVTLLIPLYIVMINFGLVDTYLGLVLAYSTFTLPYLIFLLQSFFKSIPADLEDQAMVDGCTQFQAVTKIILPLSKPGLVAAGIFSFIGGWNHYMYATILTEVQTQTFPLRLAQYIGEERVIYEMMYPAGIIGSLPVLILVFIFQKHIVKGLTEGAVKY